MFVWKCVKDFLLFVQICLSRRGLTDLGQGGMPLLVVHVGRSKRYTLRLVEGEWWPRDLLLLMLRGINVTYGSIPDCGPAIVPAWATLSEADVLGAAWISARLSVSRGVWVSPGVSDSFSRGVSAWAASSAATAWAASCRACYGGRGWGLFRGALWDVTFTELR